VASRNPCVIDDSDVTTLGNWRKDRKEIWIYFPPLRIASGISTISSANNDFRTKILDFRD